MIGEQHRVATARALVVQETTTALVQVVDARRGQLYVEDAATAHGLALAALAASQTDTPEAAQELLARVMATAQAGVRMAQGERAPKAARPLDHDTWLASLPPWHNDEDWKPLDTPTIREAALTVTEVYRHDGVGGNLHIVVDDLNVDDGDLSFCAKCIEEQDRPVAQRIAERACLAALTPLTPEERASAIRLAE